LLPPLSEPVASTTVVRDGEGGAGDLASKFLRIQCPDESPLGTLYMQTLYRISPKPAPSNFFKSLCPGAFTL
jgi:hypothetical protein